MYTQTPFGNKLNLLDPKADQIHSIEEIAFALSGLNRFNGAIPYTVAEHSIWMSHQTGNPHLKLYALLHDAHEAYIGDIPSPVAFVIGKDKVEGLKNSVQKAILEKVGLDWKTDNDPVLKWVELMDEISLLLEKRDFLINTNFKWAIEESPHDFKLFQYPPLQSEPDKRKVMGNFLKVYYENISKIH